MTDPQPVPTPAPKPAPKPSILERLSLTEPVRLYLYSLGGLVEAGLITAGVLTHAWIPFAASALATLLGVPIATESVRASVYSPAGTVAAIRRAAEHHASPPTSPASTRGPATAMFAAVTREESNRRA